MEKECMKETNTSGTTSTSKVGAKFQKNIKQQKQLSFTPKTMTRYDNNNSNWVEPHIVSFDQVLKSNEEFENDNLMIKKVASIEKKKEKRISIPFDDDNNYHNNFPNFEENFPDLMKSLKKMTTFNNCKVKEKLKEEEEEEDKHQQQQDNTSEEMKMKNLTNIQEINDFKAYTEQCIKVIAKMKAPDITTLKERMITLPFEDDIGVDKKRLAIFDLDETLIHCELKNLKSAQTTIDILLPGNKTQKVGLNIRPNWKEQLLKIATRYHIIIYTASHHCYADSVLNYLDPKAEIFEHRLYRSDCTKVECDNQTFYIKDLRIFKNISLNDMVIIDNSVLSFAFHFENGIPILPYYRGNEELEMKRLCKLLLLISDSPNLGATVSALLKVSNSKSKKKKKKSKSAKENIIEEETNNDSDN